MSFRSILRDGLGSLSRRGFGSKVVQSLVAEDDQQQQLRRDGEGEEGNGEGGRDCWAGLPPELLRDVIKRLEASESAWPARRNVVACAAVCRAWRLMCKEVVATPELCAKLTFPVSLKQPGPRSGPIQCYIKRNKGSSTYHLFLGLSPENGKFLLAAKKVRRPTRAEYIISMDAEDISRNSCSYMGKLRSNFLGTKFALYDSQPPYTGAVMSSGRSSRRFYSRKVSPKVPSGSYGIAHIAYELNMLGTRGPRRMRCTMYSIPASSLEAGGCVPCHTELPRSIEESFSSISLSQSMDHIVGRELGPVDSFASSARFSEIAVDVLGKEAPLILKNKAPRWHEQLQCWCLNFRGRVTVASVKNFQLIAAVESPEPAAAGTSQTQTSGGSEHDKILLQFGKIGKDIFTMDYRYPLSAFQAFGICLSSFDTKLACE
ncbi:tubby-like F-box protein 14 [Nymphaea colorata]|nr:tubby-like F-box protein 14 [Nymphaea colorata]